MGEKDKERERDKEREIDKEREREREKKRARLIFSQVFSMLEVGSESEVTPSLVFPHAVDSL